MHDFDLFVIGAGSGGVRAARIAATHGARVGIAEASRYGGTCVHRGCVPKKLLVYASRFRDQYVASRAYGWQLGELPAFDWSQLRDRKDAELDRLEGIYQRNLHAAGVETIGEFARIVDAHSVRLLGSNRLVTAGRILVATGGRPAVFGFPGHELAITSDDVFHLPEQPRRVLVVGGGYIGVEFAGILAGMGSEVTQFVRGPRLLRGFDPDVSDLLAAHQARRGIRTLFGPEVRSIEKVATGLRVSDSAGTHLEVDQVLLCTGRVPNTRGLGLEDAGVETDAIGAIRVDDEGRTNVDSIFAIGDVTDRVNLTPVAIREGHAFADRHYGTGPAMPMDYHLIPTAVFSTPEIGTVGLTEEGAREQYPQLRVLQTKFRAMAQAFAGSQDQVFIKVLVDGATDRVVGVHLFGDGVAEMIQLVAVALTAGATWTDFRRTVALHPTIAEEIVTLN